MGSIVDELRDLAERKGSTDALKRATEIIRDLEHQLAEARRAASGGRAKLKDSILLTIHGGVLVDIATGSRALEGVGVTVADYDLAADGLGDNRVVDSEGAEVNLDFRKVEFLPELVEGIVNGRPVEEIRT
ncbi:MAG TPA: hypothetical protein VNE39_21810 [Planctomycetota bacterium]|nr:hypothetical protein [Planctomycetota bacterium]